MLLHLPPTHRVPKNDRWCVYCQTNPWLSSKSRKRKPQGTNILKIPRKTSMGKKLRPAKHRAIPQLLDTEREATLLVCSGLRRDTAAETAQPASEQGVCVWGGPWGRHCPSAAALGPHRVHLTAHPSVSNHVSLLLLLLYSFAHSAYTKENPETQSQSFKLPQQPEPGHTCPHGGRLAKCLPLQSPADGTSERRLESLTCRRKGASRKVSRL